MSRTDTACLRKMPCRRSIVTKICRDGGLGRSIDHTCRRCRTQARFSRDKSVYSPLRLPQRHRFSQLPERIPRRKLHVSGVRSRMSVGASKAPGFEHAAPAELPCACLALGYKPRAHRNGSNIESRPAAHWVLVLQDCALLVLRHSGSSFEMLSHGSGALRE